MVIKEMQMSLASSECSFQAANEDLCLGELLKEDSQHLLSTTCELMCRDSMLADDLATLKGLGSMNLFVITSGMHYLDL